MKSNSKHLCVHPEDSANLFYWAKRWGVDAHQITNAIIETGNLNAKELKRELTRSGQIVPFVLRGSRLFKIFFYSIREIRFYPRKLKKMRVI